MILTISGVLCTLQNRPDPPGKSKDGLTEVQPGCLHFLDFTLSIPSSLCTPQKRPFPVG